MTKRRRRYGQHMLTSQKVAESLVELCEVSREDSVLEIGTGAGIITKILAERAGFVESFEIDHELYEKSRNSLSSYNNLRLVRGDVFEQDFAGEGFDACVTSLPYSESLQFIKWLATIRPQFGRCAAIVQSEFADKLTSPPGKRSYRAVSVISQISFKVKSCFTVTKEEFNPPPRVESRAILIVPARQIDQPYFNDRRIRILDLIFSFRGRRLSSALKKLVPNSQSRLIPNETSLKRVEAIHPLEYAELIPTLERSIS